MGRRRRRREPSDPGLRKPWPGFSEDHPTPILDALAARMEVLLADGEARTLREIAQAVGASPTTVDTVLRRPCARHGGRFQWAGVRRRVGGRGRAPYLWRLRDVGVSAERGADA